MPALNRRGDVWKRHGGRLGRIVPGSGPDALPVVSEVVILSIG
jgi:hypothetical protein